MSSECNKCNDQLKEKCEKKMKGKLIVIEGCDGVGKAEQSKMLSEYLTANGIKNELISFPSYGEPQALPVEKYLNDEMGELEPLEISALFAFDRLVTIRKLNIKEKLEQGIWIVMDRYVSSNVISNGWRLPKKNRLYFLEQVVGLEYGIFDLPNPSKEIYLHMSNKNANTLIKNRNKLDKNERNEKFLKKTRKFGLKIADIMDMIIISCEDDKKNLLPIPEIHKKIISEIEPLLAEGAKCESEENK